VNAAATAATGPILAVVTHARQVPADEREFFAEGLRRELKDGGLILETCHRVEAYAIGLDDAEADALAAIQPAGGRTLVGEPAVRHAITVAVGGDSVVVGEDQILHQLRASVDAARNAGSLDPALERLFAVALQSGRRARSWRQGPHRSLADVALSSIEQQRGPLRGDDILVVGAGRMGRLAARAAVRAGASVSVANRSVEGARTLAAMTGARIETFDPGARIGGFAAVVVALGGPWPITAATIEALRDGTTVVVDLSVPSAVPAGVANALGSRLITADALALVESEPGIPQDGSAARFEALIDQATAEFVAWMKGGDGRAAAEALVKRADREREAELAALWRRLPDLEPEARDAIEGMTRHLADRLLREPLERLGRDGDGYDGRAIRDIFSL
jgi:glutamyl-tRNA reductase